MTDLDELHDVKGLARGLKRAPSYVYAMTADGFRMAGQRASLRMAIQWLADRPDWSKKQVYFARRGKTGRNGESAKIVSS